MARSKNDETGQIVIRPPAGMRDRIKAAAEANNRSMNAEIVATLEEKYPAPLIDYRTHLPSLLDTLERTQRDMDQCLKYIEDAEDTEMIADLGARYIALADQRDKFMHFLRLLSQDQKTDELNPVPSA